MAQSRRFQVQFEVSGDGKVKAEFLGVADGAEKAAKAVDKAGKAADDSATKYDRMQKSAKAAGVAFGTIAAAGLALFIKNTIEMEHQQAQLGAVLKSTGEAAGFSQQKLNDMAASMSRFSTFSAGDINDAQTRLLSYSNIVGETFPRALQVAMDQAVRLGISIEQSSEIVGRALGEPTKAMAALAQQGFSLEPAQKELIKNLEATGRAAEAQALLIDMLEESYKGADRAARNTLGGALKALTKNFNDLMTGDTGSEGIKGTTEAINSMADTMGSPEVREAFQSMVSGVAMVSNEIVKGTALIVNYIANWNRMRELGNGGITRSDASYDDLNQRLGRVGGALRNIEAGKSVGSGILLPGETTVTPARRKQVVDRLMAERTALMREITARIKSEQQSGGGATAAADPRFSAEYELASLNFDPSPKGKGAAGGRTKAKKELTEAEKEWLALEKEILAHEELANDARHDFANLETQRANDRDAAAARARDSNKALIDDMRFEVELIGMTNDQRERAIAQKRVEGEATDELRLSVDQWVVSLQRARHEAEFKSELKGLFVDIGMDLDRASESVDRFFDNLKRRALEALADAAIQAMFGKGAQGTSTGAGFWANFGSNLASSFGGGLATGGPVSRGSFYEVAEQGKPELLHDANGRTFLIPGSSGTVVPAGGLGGPMMGGGGGGPMQVIVNNSTDGRVSARQETQQQPDGTVLRRMIIDVVSESLDGGQLGSVGKARYGWRDQI